MKFCVVCSNKYNEIEESILKEYKGTCPRCRYVLMDEAPGLSLYGGGGYATLDSMLDELEARMPALFNGPECPLEFENGNGCSCTFQSGCKGLKDKENKKALTND